MVRETVDELVDFRLKSRGNVMNCRQQKRGEPRIRLSINTCRDHGRKPEMGSFCRGGSPMAVIFVGRCASKPIFVTARRRYDDAFVIQPVCRVGWVVGLAKLGRFNYELGYEQKYHRRRAATRLERQRRK